MLWESMRIPDIIHWQEKWADAALHGNGPGRRAEDVSMDLVLPVESARVYGFDQVGRSIDWSKCFDTVPQGCAFKVANRPRTHPSVLQPLRGCRGRAGWKIICSLEWHHSKLPLGYLLMNTWARPARAGTRSDAKGLRRRRRSPQ